MFELDFLIPRGISPNLFAVLLLGRKTKIHGTIGIKIHQAENPTSCIRLIVRQIAGGIKMKLIIFIAIKSKKNRGMKQESKNNPSKKVM